MKRFAATLAAALSIITAVSAADTLEPKPIPADRIRLTEDQQLCRLPEGILRSTAVPVKAEGGGRVVYSLDGCHYRYDARDGKSSLCSFNAAEKADGLPCKVDGWVNPTFSPDSSRIAYTLDNDLYSIELATGRTTRLTFDGSDVILNGYASWVYYEEILRRPSKYRAFWWSPDSRLIAYYRFDNSGVPMFPIYNSTGQHGFISETRYPKAGDENPRVKVGFVPADGGETTWADFDDTLDQYFGIPFWNGEGTRLMVSWMLRSQDDLELFSVNPDDGSRISVYREHQKCWINWMEQMIFVKDGIYIVRDITGWEQVYFLSYDGKEFRQLTDDRFWSVKLLKAGNGYLFFTAKHNPTTRNDIFRINLKSDKVEKVSSGPYDFSNVMVSDDMRDVVACVSNTSTPTKLVVISIPKNGRLSSSVMRTIHDTAGEDFGKYAYATAETVMLTMRDGVQLPALVIWPVDFDASRKYPVIVNLYGGPDNPMVNDKWRAGVNQWWANHGVIQVVLDNRASGHLGKRGMEQVYRRLGILELQDFIDGIKCFTSQPYVDAAKVGVSGFSFGGTMTTLCVTEGSEWFKFGIAGGGVYDWALYDTHYTERFMDRPQDNPDGYEASRVLDRLEGYKGDSTNFLRITHGTADDNVHFQQTLQLVDTLQKQGKDFELMIYPQAVHGYSKEQGRHSDMQDYIFWYRHLFDAPLPEKLVEFYK